MFKRGIALIEMVVYVFILSFIGIYILILIKQYIANAYYNQLLMDFSKSHNMLIKKFYSNSYEGWFLTGYSENNKLYLYNSGSYIGYGCNNSGLGITYPSISTGTIDWNNITNQYSAFTCNGFSGWIASSGYWLEINIGVIDKDYTFRYYFNN